MASQSRRPHRSGRVPRGVLTAASASRSRRRSTWATGARRRCGQGRPVPRRRLRGTRGRRLQVHGLQAGRALFAAGFVVQGRLGRTARALKKQLDVFAEVLRGQARQRQPVRIEGHADASGTPEANQTLSQRRPKPSRTTWSRRAPTRDADAVGHGREGSEEPSNPFAPENRRVEIGRASALIQLPQQ